MTGEQIKELHSAIHYVCSTSVDLLADSEKFPEDWLFKHRWGKGKKNTPSVLPNGDKITFVTVGGRTSAVVPSVQKKTGPVSKEIKSEDESNEPNGNTKRKRAAPVKDESDEEQKPTKAGPKKQAKTSAKEDEGSGRRRSTRSRK